MAICAFGLPKFKNFKNKKWAKPPLACNGRNEERKFINYRYFVGGMEIGNFQMAK
jgi:hypothetical protein